MIATRRYRFGFLLETIRDAQLGNWQSEIGNNHKETLMTWIKTVSPTESEEVRKASESQRHLYPIEYATPVHPTLDGVSAGIVESHSLLPDTLFHAFATFGTLLSPDLPLQRHQHEMIATMVSVTNRCHY